MAWTAIDEGTIGRVPMIPFVDLQSRYENLKHEIDQAVLDVFENAQLALGPQVAVYEERFATYINTEPARRVNSGTSAPHLSMLAAGVGPGDEVITTPMTFIATVSPIDHVGATPVFVDIDPVTINIDPPRIEAASTPVTKAIVPVPLHGLPADLDPIMEIVERRGLVVIEDAAQAQGAEYKGHRAGSIGQIGCFSFRPGKNLGAYGEGGVYDDLTRGRLDNIADAMGRGMVRVVEGDIRDVAALDVAIDGADLVFQLAAIRITHCAEDHRLAMEVLGNGTFSAVDAAHQTSAKKVIDWSTASIYGLAEDIPTAKRRHPDNNRTLCGGDGTATMDFIYAADIARAHILAAQDDGTDDVFNIASGTETSLNGLAAALCDAMGSDLKPEYGTERSSNAVPRRLADFSHARDLLGFGAEVGLEDGLRYFVSWWPAVREDRAEATGR